MEDRGRIWVRATAPEGVGYEYMQEFMDDLARATAELVPEAHCMMTQVPGAGGGPGVPGPGEQRLRARVPQGQERARALAGADRGRSAVAARSSSTARASTSRRRRASATRATQTGVRFVVQAADLEALQEALPKFLEAARKHDVFTFVDSDLKFSKPEVRVTHRSRQGPDPRRQRARHRADAAGIAERPALRLLHLQRQAVRRHRPAHARFSLAPRRSRQHRRAHVRRRRHGAPGQSRVLRRAARRPSCIATTATAAATVSGTLAPGARWSEASPRFSEIAQTHAR